MGQVLYERPREKLRNRGVTYLTTVELVQLIVGSGSGKVSAARLAKEVGKQIDGQRLTFNSLIAINGLGEAKVCQLLAAFELGERLRRTMPSLTVTRRVANTYTNSIQLSRGAMLCVWLDGANQEIDRKQYQLDKRHQQSDSVRLLFKDALAVSARSLLIYIHKDGSNLAPDTYEVGLTGLIKESATMLHITLFDIFGVNKGTSLSWKSEL